MSFPGFISLEIRAPSLPFQQDWLIFERFSTHHFITAWHESQEYRELIEELQVLVGTNHVIQEVELEEKDLQGGVTEIIITQIDPTMEAMYRKWISKVHELETHFPGFRGIYVQSPEDSAGAQKNWITLLQFDTQENLDRWLSSDIRQSVLKEAHAFITSIETRRMISAYGGWFSSLAKTKSRIFSGMPQGMPPIWKQTMIVLLTLYPIVMLEQKFLMPWMSFVHYPTAIAIFIGNAISVTLIAWPMMPSAIFCLNWWLLPRGKNKRYATFIGTGVVLFLYLIEIAIFYD